MTHISLSLNDRQFPKQPPARNHHIIHLIPEGTTEMIISNFDRKNCCHLTAHIYGKDPTQYWGTKTDIRANTTIPFNASLAYNWAIELMPDGIKDEIIELDVDFS
jgi:hypothetical protein